MVGKEEVSKAHEPGKKEKGETSVYLCMYVCTAIPAPTPCPRQVVGVVEGQTY